MSLPDRDLQLLRKACASPQSWQKLENLILHLDEDSLNQFTGNLYELVDQSDFSLNDWIEALLTFDQWLNEEKISIRPVANMISYIHCCTLTLSDTLTPTDLAQLTYEMLKQHGFDAAAGVSPDTN